MPFLDFFRKKDKKETEEPKVEPAGATASTATAPSSTAADADAPPPAAASAEAAASASAAAAAEAPDTRQSPSPAPAVPPSMPTPMKLPPGVGEQVRTPRGDIGSGPGQPPPPAAMVRSASQSQAGMQMMMGQFRPGMPPPMMMMMANRGRGGIPLGPLPPHHQMHMHHHHQHALQHQQMGVRPPGPPGPPGSAQHMQHFHHQQHMHMMAQQHHHHQHILQHQQMGVRPVPVPQNASLNSSIASIPASAPVQQVAQPQPPLTAAPAASVASSATVPAAGDVPHVAVETQPAVSEEAPPTIPPAPLAEPPSSTSTAPPPPPLATTTTSTIPTDTPHHQVDATQSAHESEQQDPKPPQRGASMVIGVAAASAPSSGVSIVEVPTTAAAPPGAAISALDDSDSSIKFNDDDDDDGPKFQEDTDEEEATHAPQLPAQLPQAAQPVAVTGAGAPPQHPKQSAPVAPSPTASRHTEVEAQQEPHKSEKVKPSSPVRSASGKQKKRVSSEEVPQETTTLADLQPSNKTYVLTKKALVQRFAGIVAPHQAFGKIVKFLGVKVTADPADAPGSIIVGSLESHAEHFFPQVHLPGDAAADDTGAVQTPFVISELLPGAMAFASSLPEAKKLLQQSGCVFESCYVVGGGFIITKSPSQAREVGRLAVLWEKFGAHGTTQLFDQSQRDLVAALYPSEPSKTSIISEIFSATTKESMTDTLTERLAAVQRRVAAVIERHQRTVRAQRANRDAVVAQFDIMLASIEAKKQEVISQLDRESDAAVDTLARCALDCDSSIVQLNGALQHLRCSMMDAAQIESIARSLHLKVPPAPSSEQSGLARASLLHLEDVLNAVSCVALQDRGRPAAALSFEAIAPSGAATSLPTTPLKSTPNRRRTRSNIAAASRPTEPSSAPLSPVRQVNFAKENGICLFNCPLQPLIVKGRIVEWKIRIDEPGEWVAVGVGVGGTLSSWASGQTYDIGHLWVVPASAPRVLKLRVTVGSHGNAKLTVHNKAGQQLDDNRIPHWNTTRPSYPQVGFGSVAGKVTMLQAPKIL